ncbi:MAG: response regulator transcription factor [Bacteroidetes bacterium]|nr:response regulator transcription factor [Bacteroidota bacterium]MBU1114341.1 response regulator transcription factor [Bacteroidota bacterium]MBU1797119.1 response regulator transcription factor [Bacteroidota bacterium]
METNKKTRIVIADDHPLLLKGLKFTLRMDESIEVVGEAIEGKTALKLIEELLPDIAILDYDMPQLSGVEILKTISENDFPVKPIIFTMHNDAETFHNAILAGAKGYILKDTVDDDILKAISEINNGGTFISPIMAGHLLNNNEINHWKYLTNTEIKILKMVAKNKTTKEIANELFISKRTVDRHRSNICEKLNIHGNNALIKYIIENRENILSHI